MVITWRTGALVGLAATREIGSASLVWQWLRSGRPVWFVAQRRRPRDCTGGHGTSPYEQKTQQSPGFGRTVMPQRGQTQRTRQASVGIVSRAVAPHAGQWRSDVVGITPFLHDTRGYLAQSIVPRPARLCIRRVFGRAGAVAILVAALTGCALPPEVGQSVSRARQELGLEPTPFAHTDSPMPPSRAAFATNAQLGRTQRIAIADVSSRVQHSTSDGTVIRRLVTLLLLPPEQRVLDSATPAPRAALEIDLVVGPPERTFRMMYHPDTSRISLFNTPTPQWPEHLVGDYAVPPAFGPALVDALRGIP